MNYSKSPLTKKSKSFMFGRSKGKTSSSFESPGASPLSKKDDFAYKGETLQVKCQNCQCQLSVDDIITHECQKKNDFVRKVTSATNNATSNATNNTTSNTTNNEKFLNRDTLSSTSQTTSQTLSLSTPTPSRTISHLNVSTEKNNNIRMNVSQEKKIKASTSITPIPPTLSTTTNWMNNRMIQPKIRDVRVNNDGVATYGIVSLYKNQQFIKTEKRYSEIYSFIAKLNAMNPNLNLLVDMPPKTWCRNNSNGFLERRREQLEKSLIHAIQTTFTNSPSIAPLYMMKHFLDIPSDFVVSQAVSDLQRIANLSIGWKEVVKDSTFQLQEQVLDEHLTIKVTLHLDYSSSVVFDVLMTHLHEPKAINPTLIHGEILEILSNNSWVERICIQTPFPIDNREMVNLKYWNLEDEKGIIVMVPAGNHYETTIQQQKNTIPPMSTSSFEKADCVLGGWILIPDCKQEHSCQVTLILQCNFHGFLGSNSSGTRIILHQQAEQLKNLPTVLKSNQTSKQTNHHHHQILLPNETNTITTEIMKNTSSSSSSSSSSPPPPSSPNKNTDFYCCHQDISSSSNSNHNHNNIRNSNSSTTFLKMYDIVQQIEPNLQLTIHRNQNNHVVVFSYHCKNHELSSRSIRVYWINLDKPGYPRKELSTIERNTTYGFTFKNQKHVQLNLIKDKILTIKKTAETGQFGWYTTLDNQPNVQLKRIFLTSTTVLGVTKIKTIELFGRNEFHQSVYEIKKIK